MLDITEVADRVFRLEVPIPGAFVPTVAYFIKDGDGALIEPGPSAAVPAIQEAIAHLGLQKLAYIIPTHIHVDHAGGVGALAKLLHEAEVLVHPRGARHLSNPARLVANTKRIYGDDFEMRSGRVLPVPESRLKIVEDGDAITVGCRALEIIHAPGHSPDHFAVLDRSLNGLFCGEALGLPPHMLPTVAPQGFDQDAYVDTMERLRKISPSLLFYSHGGVDEDTDSAISRALENAHYYNEMVLAAIRRGDPHGDIALRFAADVNRRFGLQLGTEGSEIFVTGYTTFYEKSGRI